MFCFDLFCGKTLTTRSNLDGHQRRQRIGTTEEWYVSLPSFVTSYDSISSSAVVTALESDGTLNEIRANLRANVFRVCDNSNYKNKSIAKNIKQSDENILLNQLIREYFEFNGLKHSLNVFNAGLYLKL